MKATPDAIMFSRGAMQACIIVAGSAYITAILLMDILGWGGVLITVVLSCTSLLWYDDGVNHVRSKVEFRYIVVFLCPIIVSGIVVAWGIILVTVMGPVNPLLLFVKSLLLFFSAYVVSFACAALYAVCRPPDERLRIRYLQCKECGYRIDNIPGPRCPECGLVFIEEEDTWRPKSEQ